MTKKLNGINTPIIIIIENDATKQILWRQQFKNTEGAIIMCNTIEQAISALKDSASTNLVFEHPPQYELTKREKEVMMLLAKGLMYKEIAVILNITMGTLKQYIHLIYKKLEVVNRTEALIKFLGH